MAMQSGFIKRIRDIMRMDAGINGDAQRIEQMVWMLFLKVYDAKEDDWELNEDNYESIIPEDLRWRNWAKADSNGHAMTGDKLLNFVNNTLFPVLKGNDVKEGDTIIYEGIQVTPDTPIKKAIVKSTFEDANNYMKDGVYLRQVIDVIDEIEFDDVKESHAFGFVYEEILRELQSAGSSGEFYTPRAVTEFMALMIKPKLGEKMADFACGVINDNFCHYVPMWRRLSKIVFHLVYGRDCDISYCSKNNYKAVSIRTYINVAPSGS